MSGPIRFMILAIVIDIKNLRYVCFVRMLRPSIELVMGYFEK